MGACLSIRELFWELNSGTKTDLRITFFFFPTLAVLRIDDLGVVMRYSLKGCSAVEIIVCGSHKTTREMLPWWNITMLRDKLSH